MAEQEVDGDGQNTGGQEVDHQIPRGERGVEVVHVAPRGGEEHEPEDEVYCRAECEEARDHQAGQRESQNAGIRRFVQHPRGDDTDESERPHAIGRDAQGAAGWPQKVPCQRTHERTRTRACTGR